jgi:uncharacterized protein YacL
MKGVFYLFLFVLSALVGLFVGSFSFFGWFWGSLLGVGFGALGIGLGRLLLKASLPSLLGGIGGVLSFWVLGKAFENFCPDWLRLFLYLTLLVMGTIIGARKGPEFRAFFKKGEFLATPKILDTSAIIDGRIADICETGFIEGPLLIPQFVLKELQYIADLPDPIRRARGRRGLDLLSRLQKHSKAPVRIIEEDYPEIKEVDLKLIELARRKGGKIITNDYNLNKIAKLHGIEVLNVNELSQALRPVVLPGESLRIQVLKEGKEPEQGVGYLEDGTMVVVEDGKRLIGQEVEIMVTSVLQTPSGRIIFGREKG